MIISLHGKLMFHIDDPRRWVNYHGADLQPPLAPADPGLHPITAGDCIGHRFVLAANMFEIGLS